MPSEERAFSLWSVTPTRLVLFFVFFVFKLRTKDCVWMGYIFRIRVFYVNKISDKIGLFVACFLV